MTEHEDREHDDEQLDPEDDVSRETDDEHLDSDEAGDEDEAESFPRAYVEKLRGESKRYRDSAKEHRTRADALASALWTARVASTDRLADPEDLPLPDDADPLDLDAVAAAVDELLERKPHLAARRARGDVGQHERRTDDAGDAVSLAAMLRAGT